LADASRTALLPLAEAHEAWDDLRRRSPQRAATAHPALAEAVTEVHGWPAYVAGVWEGDRLRAGALVHTKRWGPYRAAALPPLLVPSPLLLDGPLAEAEVHARETPLDALLNVLARHVHQASLVLHPSLTDARPFTWAGWRVHPAYTYRLALAPGRDVTEGWSGGPRRLLRQSGEGYEWEVGAEVSEVVALVAESHRRQGQGFDAARARGLAERAVAAGLAEVFVVRRQGAAEAGLVALHDGETAHYWLAGSRPGPAMTVLLAEALARLRDLGVRRFDFYGANTPSIAEFKRRFGAELVPYFRARLVTRPELRALDGLLSRF
jgi:hypothetical protein